MTHAIATNSITRVAKAVVLVGLLALGACADMDETQQKVVSGGLIGAVVGTVGVAITGGCIPCGTAIGGVVGAGAGYLIDQIDKSTKSGPSNTYSTSSSSPPPSNNGYYSSSPPPSGGY